MQKWARARPIAKIEFTDGAFRFAIPPQWESNFTPVWAL